MTRLTPSQHEVLADLRAIFPHSDIVLIGATALGMHVPMTWRNTADVDLILAIDIDDLDRRLPDAGWQRDPVREQRWTAPNGVLVDIVPASAEALASDELLWPRGDVVMDLTGAAIALAHQDHRLLPELGITISTVPVIALLKMVAYSSSPDHREKDLQDLAHILAEYPPTDDDKFFTDEMLAKMAEGLDEPLARGFILGREIAEHARNDEHRALVKRFLDDTAEGPRWSRFVALSPWPHDETELRSRLDALRDGFNQQASSTKATATALATRVITITFVLNGQEVAVDTEPSAPLHEAVATALEHSHNTGRPPEEWELRFENGEAITDLDRSAEDHRIIPGTILYLH